MSSETDTIELPISLHENATRVPAIRQWRGDLATEITIIKTSVKLVDCIQGFGPQDGWLMLVGDTPGLFRFDHFGLQLPVQSQILAAEFSHEEGSLSVSTCKGRWRVQKYTKLRQNDSGDWIFSEMKTAANPQIAATGVKYWIAMHVGQDRGLEPKAQLFRGFTGATST